jgi:hypothetical protein
MPPSTPPTSPPWWCERRSSPQIVVAGIGDPGHRRLYRPGSPMPATTAFYRAKRIRGALHLLPRKNPRTSLSRSRIHRLDGQQYLKGLFLQRLVVLPRIPRSAAASQSFRIARPLRTLYTVEDMRRALLVLTCLSLGLLPGCAMHRSVKKSLAEKRVRETEARTAAEEWLALIDAANYPAASRSNWRGCGPRRRRNNSFARWKAGASLSAACSHENSSARLTRANSPARRTDITRAYCFALRSHTNPSRPSA